MLFMLLSACSSFEVKDNKSNIKVMNITLIGSGSTYEDTNAFGNTVKSQDFSQLGIEF